MNPLFSEIQCHNVLEGWRLHFAWLRLGEEEGRESALQNASQGTVSLFRRKFADNSYLNHPVVCSVRSLLRNGGFYTQQCISSFERLAQKVLEGEAINIEKPAVAFRDLLSLRSMAPWSVMDISQVSFPLVFRFAGEKEALLLHEDILTLKGCPILCDNKGKIWSPISLADEREITPLCRNIMLVCYAPVEYRQEVAAKSHVGMMVHMTGMFRFVMERSFLPQEG